MKFKSVFTLLISTILISSCNGGNKHKDTGREGFISLYAINDYHGRISQNDTQKQNGISKLSAFLNEKKYDHELEYVFLNSGDLWQDTYESNSNKGKCLTEVMEYMNCEAMELGNHEFDWGLETIRENKELAKKCTYLGANVYYYDEETGSATNQASDLCEPYKIIERNGYKIGIIGVIGKNQITSITSTVWSDLIFIDPLNVVKENSNILREQGCDLVVLLSHADTEALSLNFCSSVTTINENTNKPYIDCCFTAHTHSLEKEEYNGVPFIQGDYGGSYVSHIEFDLTSGAPVCTVNEQLRVETENTDPKVDKIVNKYINKEFIEKRDAVVANFTNVSSISTTQAGRLQAAATYEACKKIEEEKGIEIVCAINNGGRDTLRLPSDGNLTREMVFNLTPFTNKTYIAQVTGANLKYVITSNKYYAPNKLIINKDNLYYVACIDYVLFHKTSARKYDNFTSYDGNYVSIIEEFPDELVYEFINGKTIDKSFFSSPEFSNLS